MNLIKKITKLPLFKLGLIFFVIVVLWQIVAIRKEMYTIERKQQGFRPYIFRSSSSSDLEYRVDDLESKVDGVYGLEYRVDDLESEIRKLKRRIDYLELQ